MLVTPYLSLLQIRSSSTVVSSSLTHQGPNVGRPFSNRDSLSGEPKRPSTADDDESDDPLPLPAARYGWVVLDGPVDPLWVEMLNPVLDDNRALCLINGETIPLREGVNIIMEVNGVWH